MSTMVENVARAMWDQRRKFAGSVPIELEDWGDGSVPRANGIFEEAVAAMAALRVPTAQMVNAAWYDYENSPNGVLVEERSVDHASPDSLSSDTAYEVWQAMIDVALKETT